MLSKEVIYPLMPPEGYPPATNGMTLEQFNTKMKEWEGQTGDERQKVKENTKEKSLKIIQMELVHSFLYYYSI